MLTRWLVCSTMVFSKIMKPIIGCESSSQTVVHRGSSSPTDPRRCLTKAYSSKVDHARSRRLKNYKTGISRPGVECQTVEKTWILNTSTTGTWLSCVHGLICLASLCFNLNSTSNHFNYRVSHTFSSGRLRQKFGGFKCIYSTHSQQIKPSNWRDCQLALVA